MQKFAENKINEIKEKDYGGRQEETKIQRKAMLKEWFDYVLSVVMSEKKDNCNVLVKKLPNSYNCNYPIIEGKHQR